MQETLENPRPVLETEQAPDLSQSTPEREFGDADLEQARSAAESNIEISQAETLNSADARIAHAQSLGLNAESVQSIQSDHLPAIQSVKEKIVALGDEAKRSVATAARSETAATNHSESSVREFSKRYAPMARDVLAGQLRQLKEQLNQQRLAARENLASEHAEKTAQLQEKETEYAKLEQQLNEVKNGFLAKFFRRAEISTLQADLQERRATLDQLRKDFEDRSALLSEAGELAAIEDDRSKIRSKLDAFYQTQEGIKTQFENERDLRSVDQVSRREKVFFIHGMAMAGEVQNGTGDNNKSLDGSKVGFETKMRLILGLEPTLSCSTLKAGDTKERMSQKAGLILRRGQVLYAKDEDAYTVTENGARRSKDQSEGYNPLVSDIQENPQANIKRAIDRTEVKGFRADMYNELIVQDPECAGIYFDAEHYAQQPDKIEQLKQISQDMGVPLYVWTKDGMVEYGQTQPASVTEVLDKEPVLSSEEKRRMLESAVAESPFKIDQETQKQYNCFEQGSWVYGLIQGDKSVRSMPYTGFLIPGEGGFEKYLGNIDAILDGADGIIQKKADYKRQLQAEGLSYKQIRYIKEEADSMMDPEAIYMQVYGAFEIAKQKNDAAAVQTILSWLEKRGVLQACQNFVVERVGADGKIQFVPEKDVPLEIKAKLKAA